MLKLFRIASRHWSRCFFRLMVVGSGWLLGVGVGQAAESVNEYSLKAAYLFNFAQFVQWPAGTYASTNAPIVVGVLGNGNFPADLQAIDGKTVPGRGEGRHIMLKHVASAKEVGHCQILFILRSGQTALPEVMHDASMHNILTVLEDSEDLAQTHAVINLFKTTDNRIRFEINVDAAKRADLKVDSALLNLAKMVREPLTQPVMAK